MVIFDIRLGKSKTRYKGKKGSRGLKSGKEAVSPEWH